jgi:hypothetical protein
VNDPRESIPGWTPPEPYVDVRELARIMGVSTRTIVRFRNEGMPSETWGMTRTRRYLASQCIAWARERD